MTLFELVKVALDELYSEAVGIYGKDTDVNIQQKMNYLTQQYRNLAVQNTKPIDYKDPAVRFAYVYKYVATHGDYIVQVLQGCRQEVSSLFHQTDLRVACIGGGPGSDIIGVVKYISDLKNAPERITAYLLDGEQAWADTWTEFASSFQHKVVLNVNFQQLQVTQPQSWQYQKRFLLADLFTLSYFTSEVYSQDGNGEVSAFYKAIFDAAKPGAVFLYIDNGADTFNEYFDQRWQSRGDIEYLAEETNVRRIPSFSEQAAELGDYRLKFGHQPKLQAQLSYRVLRKIP